MLYVRVPKLNKNEVLVLGSLALVFDVDLAGGHANNFLVKNVSRALVDKMVVKYEGTVLQDTVGYDLYKIWEDLFLSQEERNNMYREEIQSEAISKLRSEAGDRDTSDAKETKLGGIYGKKRWIRLDHQILTDHGVFYPQALYNNLAFELTLAEAKHVVRGSDATKLVYKLKNIHLEYKMIRSKKLAEEARSVYASGKEFLYDHAHREKAVTYGKNTDATMTIKFNPQRRSLKAILVLFMETYTAGARDSEKFFNPNITKVKVTGVPNWLYNKDLETTDLWEAVSGFFVKKSNKTQYMNAHKFYPDNKFGLLIDLRSMDA